MNRKSTFFIDTVKEHCFLNTKVIELKGAGYKLPIKTVATKGKHSIDECENCKKQRDIIISNVSLKLEEFPSCCQYHLKLNKLEIFDKKDFINIYTSIADKVMFTYQHIINNLDNDDWYEDISDYLEYTLESCGSFPKGYGEPFYYTSYLGWLKSMIKSIEGKVESDLISSIEIKTRLNKVYLLFESDKGELSPEKDFGLLLNKYEEWYKIFPFDLLFFKHLKEKFKKTLPIYTGRKRYNKYLNTTKRELHTKDSFSIILMQITKEILTSINGFVLYEKGEINDADKIKLELVIENRKLELYEISNMPNSKRQDYIKVLKKWFKQEKRFIKEITPLLQKKELGVNKPRNKFNRPNRTDIAYYCYYTSQTKTLKLESIFPSDKAWVEIGRKFNKNHKNIQLAYNSIASSQFERLKSSKATNIKYVINNMLNDNEKAQNLANDELKLLELNS